MKSQKLYPAALIRNLYYSSGKCGEIRTFIKGLSEDLTPWEKEKEYKKQIQAVLDELYYLNVAIEEAETVLFAAANSLELGIDYTDVYAKFAPIEETVEKQDEN